MTLPPQGSYDRMCGLPNVRNGSEALAAALGGKLLLGAFESRVVLNHASARLIIERELLEIRGRHAF